MGETLRMRRMGWLALVACGLSALVMAGLLGLVFEAALTLAGSR
jgi:hypothetical protein